MSPSIFLGTKPPSISWARLQSVKATADLINRYPDRFLFGTDSCCSQVPETILGAL